MIKCTGKTVITGNYTNGSVNNHFLGDLAANTNVFERALVEFNDPETYSNMHSSRIGTTANRPTGLEIIPGRTYFDTILSKSIVYNGLAWVNVDGSAL